jgi:autotransporter-associated beta strand protein
MKRRTKIHTSLFACFMTLVVAEFQEIYAQATLTFNNATTAYSQDFDSLALTATSSSMPTGWLFSEAGSNADTTYAAGTGSVNTGNTYSFGSTSSAERAFGTLLSGSLTSTIGASFQNTTGLQLVDVRISYRGEQWRLGATSRVDQLDFQYSTNATSLTTGTYNDLNALDFVAPVTTGALGAKDGNASPNFTNISASLTSLNLANNASFFIRWTDLNASGADDGLAVDDFTMRVDKLGTNGTDAALTSLDGPSTLVIQNGHVSTASTLTANLTTTQTFAGVLQNGGAASLALTKTGIGTLNLTNSNTYSGGTTISDGTLNITNTSGSATGSGSLTLDASRTLSGTGIIAPATDTNINLNGSLIVGDTTLGSPVASSITLATSGSGVTSTSADSLFHFDLFTRFGGANPLGSAADYVKLPGTLDNSNGGTIVITNRTGSPTFALGDSWHLFDFTGGGTITDNFNVDYTDLGLSGDLIGQFDRLSGTFSIVPEPSRTLFLALGLLTLTLRRRR